MFLDSITYFGLIGESGKAMFNSITSGGTA